MLILQRGRVVYFGGNGLALSDYFGQEQLQVWQLTHRNLRLAGSGRTRSAGFRKRDLSLHMVIGVLWQSSHAQTAKSTVGCCPELHDDRVDADFEQHITYAHAVLTHRFWPLCRCGRWVPVRRSRSTLWT